MAPKMPAPKAKVPPQAAGKKAAVEPQQKKETKTQAKASEKPVSAAPPKSAVKPSDVSKKAAKPRQQIKAKGAKKKKLNLKFTIDSTHPCEDGIMDIDSFVSNFHKSSKHLTCSVLQNVCIHSSTFQVF
ncbi:hypothetical protein QYM36_019409 [Artemia franciscana]|uniref:Uncharacterized protein n=1 Tax=Artemia franciscana TaxID=6661 RepID=A0AA88H5A6_ARTSF|nr:hypothetical protein QYM36_019409 [Artemia franciscana]